MTTISIFSSSDGRDLLRNKSVYLFGCSNIRSLYKDIIWLLEKGTLTPNQSLRARNEQSFEKDVRLSQDFLHNGVDYVEIREYHEGLCNIRFSFLTRLNLPTFVKEIERLKKSPPDVIAISSCIWDLTRWGENWFEQYRDNLNSTFLHLKSNLPNTRVIWLTSFPTSFKCRGSIFVNHPMIDFQRVMLPFNIVLANQYAASVAKEFSYDVLDYHNVFQYLMHMQTEDGIHWNNEAVRYMTNMLLTHLARMWKVEPPELPRICSDSIDEWNRALEKEHKNRLNINNRD